MIGASTIWPMDWPVTSPGKRQERWPDGRTHPLQIDQDASTRPRGRNIVTAFPSAACWPSTYLSRGLDAFQRREVATDSGKRHESVATQPERYHPLPQTEPYSLGRLLPATGSGWLCANAGRTGEKSPRATAHQRSSLRIRPAGNMAIYWHMCVSRCRLGNQTAGHLNRPLGPQVSFMSRS
jgi:hypothetical protein